MKKTNINSTEPLLKVTEAAALLGIDIDTLRRWGSKGKLKPIRTRGGHRRYPVSLLRKVLKGNYLSLAKLWAKYGGWQPESIVYCPDRAIFIARINAMERLLEKRIGPVYSIISSSAGELGNNSFNHNLGKWRDIPGLYFAYNLEQKWIVLADRGQGILKTLQNTAMGLVKDEEALFVAFTEVITGRAPEKRGNGLKYVRRNIEKGFFNLEFHSRNAYLSLKVNQQISQKKIITTRNLIPGCMAIIRYGADKE